MRLSTVSVVANAFSVEGICLQTYLQNFRNKPDLVNTNVRRILKRSWDFFSRAELLSISSCKFFFCGSMILNLHFPVATEHFEILIYSFLLFPLNFFDTDFESGSG